MEQLARGSLVVMIALVLGCKGSESSSSTKPAASTSSAATAAGAPIDVSLASKSGSTLAGKATFTEGADGVKVVIDISGVDPGKHAAHVHQNPDCSSADAKSAGDHYSPDGHPHALPPSEPRHLGDFGNITVGDDKKGHLEITVAKANLKTGDAHSFINRAVVIHAKTDDGGQPSGNAGDRIGCGEIKR